MGTRLVHAAAGVAAGAATLGVAEVTAAVLVRSWCSGTPSPLVAVGAAFVEIVPQALAEWAIGLFGAADKAVLFLCMALVLIACFACIGMLAARSPLAGLLTTALLAGVALAAVLTRTEAVWTDLLPTVLGAVLGWRMLAWLASPDESAAHVGARRDAMRRAGLLAGLGVLGVVLGRFGSQLSGSARRVREIIIPSVPEPVVVPAGASSQVQGHTSFITPNTDFYRIDTALVVPQIDPDSWSLRITGMVEREVTITFDELLGAELIEAMITLTCVSNEVGGSLAGNAVWTGVPVRDLLARAGVRAGADMVLSRSVDGWTAGTPLEVLTDDRNALLAIGMNGEALPSQHGFPARLVVPGLYGYVSATKWVTELKVTTFAADDGYWTPRGWSERGPIKLASRIDVPRAGSKVAAGQVMVAGVAWAQTRGIAAVELSVDGGPWRQTELLAEPTLDAWRLWSLAWDATPGEHQLRVRAVDGSGELQTEVVAFPVPDGASGWHTITVRVE